MLQTENVLPHELKALLDHLPNYGEADRALVERAYFTAESAHDGQIRKSGEPYFTHCVAVAEILADMQLDSEAIAAALLHDVVEDTDISLENLQMEFGVNVASIVDGVTKLKHLPINMERGVNKRNWNSDRERELEYIRKMLLAAMGDDVRILLVKLADRLHNMRTLGYMPRHKQIAKAQETRDIFAPLANRLGIWQIKWELEDLCLKYLEPHWYSSIATSLAEQRTARESYLSKVVEILRDELKKHGILNSHITGRPKHIYSIYRKMRRKALSFDQIHDIRAVRVIVDTVPQCYLVLGIVHNMWRPIPGEFDDYIAAPKDNFYQSLHTAVLDNNGKTVEVQIRTRSQHEHAEYGIAAHWRYKEDGQRHDAEFERRLNYLRRLIATGTDFNDEENAETFVNRIKDEVFQDRVYAFTPKGDIIDLPAGATPIDFAYHIHTDVGHYCGGAKIHGKLVSLNYQLKTGDQVQIIRSRREGPSLDWLNPDAGFTKTSRARSKIRQWFRKQNREKNVTNGREMLEKELKRLGLLDAMSYESVAHLFDIHKVDDFLAQIGTGEITSAQIAQQILENERSDKKLTLEEEVAEVKPRASSMALDATDGISITGMKGMLVSIAQCCQPLPSDEVVGYVTRGRGVTVHRRDCPNMQALREPERLVEVSWYDDSQESRFSVPVEIVAYDREGLMRDISTVITDAQVNMSTINVVTQHEIATFQVTMEIADVQQLTRVLARLEQIPNVVDAHRRNAT